MAELDDLGDFGPAEVEVAVLEAELLVHIGGLVDVEGRRDRLVEDGHGGGDHFDLAGGHVGVHGCGVAGLDGALDLEDPFDARAVGGGVGLGVLRVQNELDDAAGIAEVDEDEAAVVAAAVDPAGDADG